jgi:deazaflavin-dependent oxidoreductase (nitroreductase family)
MLLLTTTGNRSGRHRTVPLLYLSDGDSLVVFASYGGRHHHPAWYHNLLADPRADVRIRGRRHRVVARIASGPTRDRLWNRAVSAYDGFAVYQSRTDREIPVVLLAPLA